MDYIDLEFAFFAQANTGAVVVGGALGDTAAGFQIALSSLSHAKLWRDVSIYTDITLGAHLHVDGAPGTLVTRMTIEGVDVTGARLTAGATRPIITTTADLDIGLLDIHAGVSYSISAS